MPQIMSNKIFAFVESLDVFNTLKIASDESNNDYTIGQNDILILGTPDIKWEQLAFIAKESIIWTHGNMYHCGSHNDIEKIIKELVASKEQADDFGSAINNLQRQIDLLTALDSKSMIDPQDDETPKFFWEGQLPNTKADGEYRGILRYVSKNVTLTFYATLTVQGSSSVNYAKKNYTIKFYTDDTYTVKLKVAFKNWGLHDSYVLKANWVDHTHCRIIAASEIWKQIMESRSDYSELPEEIQNATGHGATQGWSARFYVNGLYYGLYELIIAKKDIFGQSKTNTDHSIIVSESNRERLCAFDKDTWTNSEFDACWSEELQSSISDKSRNSFGNIIKLICSGSDEEVKEQLPTIVDLQSVIDFDIFARMLSLKDNIGKNQIFYTYDSEFWYEGAWDLDWAFNSSASTKWQDDYQIYAEGGLINKLYDRVEQIWLEEFKTRYFELRSSVLSTYNMTSIFEHFNDNVAPWLDEDYAETTGKGQFTELAQKVNSNIQSIRNQICYRTIYMDGIINAMIKRVSPVLINVDKINQTFTLSCETPDTTIYYTLDGSTPDSSSTVYTGETQFEFNTTIKAIGIREGSDPSSVLEYKFEPLDYVELFPIKRIYNTSIRANEKDINVSSAQHLDVYENRPENYPLFIKGKYLNTAAKYAFVNTDFINNPVTENLVDVQGKYPWISTGMTEPEQVDTEITEYVDAPYIAVVVIEQGGGLKVDRNDWFTLYTTNKVAETEFEAAIPIKTFDGYKFDNGSGGVLKSNQYNNNLDLYENVPGKAPYILEGQHMITNSSAWAFVTEDFYNNPSDDNVLLLNGSADNYPYVGSQVEPINYRIVVPLRNMVIDAPYIAVSTCKNPNIDPENRTKLYIKK